MRETELPRVQHLAQKLPPATVHFVASQRMTEVF